MKIDIDKLTEAELAEGQRWNVSPSFLRKAEPNEVAPIKGNVIPMKWPG